MTAKRVTISAQADNKARLFVYGAKLNVDEVELDLQRTDGVVIRFLGGPTFYKALRDAADAALKHQEQLLKTG